MDSTRDAPYRPLLDAYLAGLDRTLPAETVAGVYLTGSIALDDYRHGSSDLDLLALTARPLTDAELDALDGLHRELKAEAQPYADAAYVSRDHVGKLPPQGFGTGPGRLHRTIATGEIISKTRSAEYTAEVFPAYAQLLGRARAFRLGDDSVEFTRTDAFALCDLVDDVCDSSAALC